MNIQVCIWVCLQLDWSLSSLTFEIELNTNARFQTRRQTVGFSCRHTRFYAFALYCYFSNLPNICDFFVFGIHEVAFLRLSRSVDESLCACA